MIDPHEKNQVDYDPGNKTESISIPILKPR